MQSYEQVLEIVELALAKGEYHFCIKFLSPIIESFPLSSKEGVNLRTILITALCGINKKEDAKNFCKDLLKSYDYKTRENAKYLMEIIDSPEIKKPENWNISFEKNDTLRSGSQNSLSSKKDSSKEKKFINLDNAPTGATKPFQKGFTLIIILILLILIPLLSGCVKIQNTIDLSEIDSINNYLKVESKYINKFPWQIKFEEEIKNTLPDAEISIEDTNFSLKSKSLNIESAENTLKKILETAGNLSDFSTDLEIKSTEKNFVVLKKNFYKINLDLQTVSDIKNLEIDFKIIHPNIATYSGVDENHLEISKNLIVWNLIPGEINTLEFSFWSWNKLLIGTMLISFILILTYFVRFYRYKLGTELPQLPSE